MSGLPSAVGQAILDNVGETAARLFDAHDALIWLLAVAVESAPGTGSTFRITLPRDVRVGARE